MFLLAGHVIILEVFQPSDWYRDLQCEGQGHIDFKIRQVLASLILFVCFVSPDYSSGSALFILSLCNGFALFWVKNVPLSVLVRSGCKVEQPTVGNLVRLAGKQFSYYHHLFTTWRVKNNVWLICSDGTVFQTIFRIKCGQPWLVTSCFTNHWNLYLLRKGGNSFLPAKTLFEYDFLVDEDKICWSSR